MMQAGLGWLVFFNPAVVKKMGVGIEPLGVVAEGWLTLWLLAMDVNVGNCQK